MRGYRDAQEPRGRSDGMGGTMVPTGMGACWRSIALNSTALCGRAVGSFERAAMMAGLMSADRPVDADSGSSGAGSWTMR